MDMVQIPEESLGFDLTTMFKMTLGAIQHSVQHVEGILSLRVNGLEY